MDVESLATPKVGLIAGQWFSALVMFSCMASAGTAKDSARGYVVAIGVLAWLATSGLVACYLLGYAGAMPTFHVDYQGPVLQITGKLTVDLVYYCLFTFFSLVAFFCAAGHAHGSGNAAASAFFAVLLTGTTGAAALLTYKEAADEALMSEGPMLNPGQPASMSGPSNLPPNF